MDHCKPNPNVNVINLTVFIKLQHQTINSTRRKIEPPNIESRIASAEVWNRFAIFFYISADRQRFDTPFDPV